MENNTKEIRLDLFKICWYMRGGMSWQQSLALSPDERTIAAQLVKENLDTTKKTGRDFF